MTRFAPMPPVRLPRSGDMRARHRIGLTAEILVVYLPLLRALRREPLPQLLAQVRAPSRRSPVTPADEHEIAVRLGAIVGHVLEKLPTDQRCLIRSIVLLRLLARRSIDARLVLGVRSDGRFAAHAWVEHDEQPVLPAGDFATLARL